MACSKPVPPPSIGQNGKIGVQYRRVDDWMLVTKVLRGMSAETAGILPGDRLLEVDGKPVFDGNNNRIAGPVDTSITLTVQSPFDTEQHSVTLMRKVAVKSRQVTQSQKKVYDLLSIPSEERGPWFEDASNGFNGYWERQDFWSLLQKHSKLKGWSEKELQDLAQHAPSLHDLERLQVRFPQYDLLKESPLKQADAVVWGADGQSLLSSGWPMLEWRTLQNQWEALTENNSEPPSAILEDIRTRAQHYHWNTALLKSFGMAPYEPQKEWTAPVPPPKLPALELFDQTPWSWESDGLTVVNLWATWCGPCRKEMPEFVALSEGFQGKAVRFLAVSTDKMSDRDKVDAMVDEWSLPFAVAHEPSINRAFQVTGIPAIRVLNAEGQLVYTRKGYSPTAMTELSDALNSLLDNPKPLEQQMAYRLTEADITLETFIPVSDVQSLSVSDGLLWVSRYQHHPVALETIDTIVDSSTSEGYHPNELITHDQQFGAGPVTADIGGYLIRAYDEAGRSKWVQSTRTPIRDMHAVNGLLYVQTKAAILVLEPDGSLKSKFEGEWIDIERGEDGLWALNEKELMHVREASLEPQVERPVAAVYAQQDGGLRQALYSQALISTARQENSPILYRPKRGEIPAAVVFGNSPEQSHTLFLKGVGHDIELWDSKKDGQAELAIAFPNIGIAVFRLNNDK